ncbi:hypothetical protein FY206_16905 [Enterobacter chengduensis]|nr:hypothetical protein FY206_16905 [Enterobacter chengduensis]
MQLHPPCHKASAFLIGYKYLPSHGVSGVGGSNPLVPTKNTLKTSLLRLVFYFASSGVLRRYTSVPRQITAPA